MIERVLVAPARRRIPETRRPSAASIASSPTRAHRSSDRATPRTSRPARVQFRAPTRLYSGPRDQEASSASRTFKRTRSSSARAASTSEKGPASAAASPVPAGPPGLSAARARARAVLCHTPPGHSARSTEVHGGLRRLGRAQRAQLGGGEVLHGGAREKLERLPRQRHDGSPHDALRAQVEHGLEQPEQTAARERVHRRDLRGVVFRRFSRGFVGVRRKRRGREVRKRAPRARRRRAFLRRSIRRRDGTRGDAKRTRDRARGRGPAVGGARFARCSFRTFRIGVCSDRARGRRLGEGNGRRSPTRRRARRDGNGNVVGALRTLPRAPRAPAATVSATLVADAERERL